MPTSFKPCDRLYSMRYGINKDIQLKLSRFPTGCKIAWLLQIAGRVVDEITSPFLVIEPFVITGFGQKLS